ncbi:peptidoglycan-binding domain-containing protein [Agrobacterium pusense]|uniref:peptidoglycan-binding protein n=1 Tax=Agrobacterium pusense TaxID=648995 RepID=UPI002FDEC9AE
MEYYTASASWCAGTMSKTFVASRPPRNGRGYYKGNLDGLDGQQRRAAIHLMLVDLAPKAQVAQVRIEAAPVTEETVAITPPSLDALLWKSKGAIVPIVTGGGLSTGLAAVGTMPWQNLALVRLAFGIAGAFLLWRKKAHVKAVSDQVTGMALVVRSFPVE